MQRASLSVKVPDGDAKPAFAKKIHLTDATFVAAIERLGQKDQMIKAELKAKWDLRSRSLSVIASLDGKKGKLTAKAGARGLTLHDAVKAVASGKWTKKMDFLKLVKVHSLILLSDGGRLSHCEIEFELGNALVRGIRAKVDVEKPFTKHAKMELHSTGRFGPFNVRPLSVFCIHHYSQSQICRDISSAFTTSYSGVCGVRRWSS